MARSAVDRRGQAWVLFDSGEIFWVDIADASCRPIGFAPDQHEFQTFGMGFVSESRGGMKTLCIAGGPDIETAVADTRLGTIESLGMPPSGSEIHRLDPETGDLVFLLFDYRTRVDAGVSTCAPILI